MAGDIKQKFGTANQTITVTVASLGNNSAQESDAIDNSSNLYQDALVGGKVTSASSGTSSSGAVNIYAYGSADGGTTYSDGCSGSNSAHTMVNPPNARLIGQVNVVANSTTYEFGPFSVAAAFGGVLPASWGIIVENKSGATLNSTAGNHNFHYQGVYSQYT